MAVQAKKLEKTPHLRGNMMAKVKTAGNTVEIMVSTKDIDSDGCPCKRLSKDEYVDLRTGEVGQYQHEENRAGNQRAFFRTLNRIRDLINANVLDAESVRWSTFTYRENMTDTVRLYNDWNIFWKRFKRYCQQNGIKIPKYIMVVEPQGRGAWHMHVLFIWEGKAPFINNNEVLQPMWGHGFTKIQAVKGGIDNIGAYFGAYLTDIPLDEYTEKTGKIPSPEFVAEKDFTTQEGGKNKKKFVKGGRVHMYPSGMNILRHSRGLKEPEIEEMTFEEAKKKVSGATETYQTAFSVSYDTGEEITQYVRMYYNTADQKRKEICQTKCETDRKTVKESQEERKERLLKELQAQRQKEQEARKKASDPVRMTPRVTVMHSRNGKRLYSCKSCGLVAVSDYFQSYQGNTGECIVCYKKRYKRWKKEQERAGALY